MWQCEQTALKDRWRIAGQSDRVAEPLAQRGRDLRHRGQVAAALGLHLDLVPAGDPAGSR